VGLGAAAATVACVVSILTLLASATDQRPDSLAALVESLATPDLAPPPDLDGTIETRWNERFRQANETAEQEAVFALSDAIAREQHDRRTGSGLGRRRTDEADANVQQIYALLDVVSRARFEPARDGRLPVLPWVAMSTTVYAAKPQPIAAPVSAPKRRADFLILRSSRA
jgi:hypothetical protein